MVYRIPGLCVEARMHLVDREERVRCAGPNCPQISIDHGLEGVRLEQRIGRMSHQVVLRRDIGDVIREHQIHGNEVTAKFGLSVADHHPLTFDQSLIGEDLASIRIDHDLVDLGNG